MRIDTSFKAACVLTDIASKVIDFREHMGNKYNLHLRADTDKAFVRYKKKF